METPRFAVDRMLGRLARWLRLLGFDALLRPDLPGRRLATLAAREGRILLTRDRALVRWLTRTRSPVEVLCVEADRFRDQLRELDRVHPLGPDPSRAPRCVECNAGLERLAPDRLPASVPEYVRATQREFHHCPGCRRVYWPATHWQRMQAELADLCLTKPDGARGDGGAEGGSSGEPPGCTADPAAGSCP